MQRSSVEKLPEDVRLWLEKALVDNAFGGYQALSDYLKGQGYAISKSSLQRFGSTFEKRLNAMQLASQQAAEVVRALPDGDNAINDALIRLVQEQLFGVLLGNSSDVATEPIDLSKMARAIADLGRASISQKRWAEEARAKALAEAGNMAERQAKEKGLSAEAAQAIRNSILGIAS